MYFYLGILFRDYPDCLNREHKLSFCLNKLCEITNKSLGTLGSYRRKLKYIDGTLIYYGTLIFSETNTIEFETPFIDKIISISTIVSANEGNNITVSCSKLEKNSVAFVSNNKPTFYYTIIGRWK